MVLSCLAGLGRLASRIVKAASEAWGLFVKKWMVGSRGVRRRRDRATSPRCARITASRLSLRLGVSSPPSSVQATGSTAYLRIASAWETALLASSTASSSSARRSASSSRSVRAVGLPRCSAHAVTDSGSRVISAAMNGRPSPTTMHWSTRGWARSRSSSTAGATFLPPAVTRISLLRPVIRTKPSSSISPRSPVWNQPSRSSTSTVAGSSPQYPANTWPPRKSSSPSSATRTVVPGIGRPTVPILTASGVFTVSAAVVSVRP